MRAQPQKDPFAPVEAVVNTLLRFAVALVLLLGGVGVVERAFGDPVDTSIATIGEPDACATVAPGEVPYGESDVSGDAFSPGDQEGVVGMRESIASSMTREIEICIAHPTWVQKAAATVEPVGAVVFGLVSLVLIRRTIVRARRDGLFNLATAARTRQLGWFVVLMTTVYPLAAAAGRGVVVSAAVREVSWTSQLLHPHISLALLVVGLGVITFGRILGRAASLQQEVDLTV